MWKTLPIFFVNLCAYMSKARLCRVFTDSVNGYRVVRSNQQHTVKLKRFHIDFKRIKLVIIILILIDSNTQVDFRNLTMQTASDLSSQEVRKVSLSKKVIKIAEV